MKNRIRKSLIALIFLGYMAPAKPISEKSALIGSLAGGLGVGAASGLLTQYVFLEDSRLTNGQKALISIIVGTGAGALTWWALHSFLYSYTPREKIRRVEKIVMTIEMDSLISRNFTSPEEIINAVNACFGTNWPLVTARTKLTDFVQSLIIAREILLDTKQEITQNRLLYPGLISSCDQVFEKITALSKKIEQRIGTLIAHKNFNIQLQLYQDHLELQLQRDHEHSLLSTSLSHDTWERWKDRDFKKNIANNNPHRPVMLNI
ncbi:MAG: hypothetical protein V1855_02525 [bacterium]